MICEHYEFHFLMYQFVRVISKFTDLIQGIGHSRYALLLLPDSKYQNTNYHIGCQCVATLVFI